MPRFRLRADRAADNSSYLGFLHTLASRSVSLYQFGQRGTSESTVADVDAIITNFGIALATTILGILLRVVSAQMREDPYEFEREARESLATAVGKVKDKLDATVVAVNQLRRAALQSVQEGWEESGRTMRAAIEGIAKAGEAAAAATSQRLKTAASGVESGLDRLAGALAGFDRGIGAPIAASCASSGSPARSTRPPRAPGRWLSSSELAHDQVERDVAAVRRFRETLEREAAAAREAVMTTRRTLAELDGSAVEQRDAR